jgi:hypothetical protein
MSSESSDDFQVEEQILEPTILPQQIPSNNDDLIDKN